MTLLRSVALKREWLNRHIGFLLLTSSSVTSALDVRCSMFDVRRFLQPYLLTSSFQLPLQVAAIDPIAIL
jgi:chorismate-pyruvate lyase